MPTSAPAFIALNTDTESPQWQTVDDLARRFPDKEKATRMVSESLRKEGLSWKRDVRPGLGPEVNLVWLDLDHGGQDFAVLLRPDDEEKFKRLTKKAEGTADFFQIKIGEWQVLAQSQKLLDRFRSESGSGDSLADAKPFRQAMHAYPDDYLLRAYVDGAAVMKAARAEQDPDFQKLLPKLGRLDWLATNLRVTPDGVRWDLNIHGTAGPALTGVTPTRPFKPALAHEVPKDAFAYATFHGAKGMLTGLEHNPILADTPELHRYAGLLRRIETLLQGENAIWVRPSRSGTIPR